MATISPFKLMFVCSGNDARSPLAEACAQAVLSSNGSAATWRVLSAGTDAVQGQPCRPEVEQLGRSMGFNLAGWRARPLTPDVAAEQDLILAMTWDQVSHVWSAVPGSYDRCFTLKEFIHYAKRAPSQPLILFPDRAEHMRDRVRQSHALRKRARSEDGFWGGLRPQDLNLGEPEAADEGSWQNLGQAVRALVVDSIRLLGGP